VVTTISAVQDRPGKEPGESGGSNSKVNGTVSSGKAISEGWGPCVKNAKVMVRNGRG